MSNLPMASKSPKGKSSNGHKPTGAMTATNPQPKPDNGRGLSAGNHPTNASNDRVSPLKRNLMKMNGMNLKSLGK